MRGLLRFDHNDGPSPVGTRMIASFEEFKLVVKRFCDMRVSRGIKTLHIVGHSLWDA